MISKEDAKKEVNKLIGKYKSKIQSGSKYNEEMTKKDFILPLFRALGWDVEDSNEVTAEESLLKGAVDYAFLIDKNYKFFVEAKPLGSDLKKFAQQAIEYGVNSGNTWVVLTSFESLVVFNCEWKEKEWWKNSLFSLEVKDYLDSFDKLWLLSKESTANNALDNYASIISKGVPRTPIDKELLLKFLQYRTKLSKEISKNSTYSEEEIDEIVQRLLVRLLFIRNCEDRGFETKYKLLSIIKGFKTHKKGLSRFMKLVFEHYDKNYDSSIFEEMEIDKVKFDEELLAEIIEGLYYTNDGLRYDFNIIPSDVMGRLYEQYLGHILKKTPQTAKLKEGKAHRKEQGIYYTPTYIVEYIVRNTLGELLKGKKVDASKIRVLDPACGSGSFLVKAFDVLNEHYAKDKMYGQKTLTGYSTKERILKNNIFGVDLDKQAIEIAQLNLLLRIAEKGQKLPLLKQNVKIGNSLIDDEKIAGDKAFKWEEQFKDVMKEGGFDVVIGNPPYIRIQEIPEKEANYLLKNSSVSTGYIDTYMLFTERAINLLKEGGLFSFIMPSKFMSSNYGEGLRKFILQNCKILKIVDFGDLPVFESATTYPAIYVFKKQKVKGASFYYYKIKDLNSAIIGEIEKDKGTLIKQESLNEKVWNFGDINEMKILEKLNNINLKLNDVCDKIFQGLITSADEVFILKEKEGKLFSESKKDFVNLEKNILKKIIKGLEIKKYKEPFSSRFIIFPYKKIEERYSLIPEEELKEKFPKAYKYLLENKELLKKRTDVKNNKIKWYAFSRPQNLEEFETQKVLTPFNAFSNSFTLDKEKVWFFTAGVAGGYGLKIKKEYNKEYILGILDSGLIEFFIKKTSTFLRGGYYSYENRFIKNVPIKTLNSEQEKEIIRLVNKMLSLNKRLNELGDKKTDKVTKLKEEISKTDAEIDELVYKIYGITDKEKKIIEESLK